MSDGAVNNFPGVWKDIMPIAYDNGFHVFDSLWYVPNSAKICIQIHNQPKSLMT